LAYGRFYATWKRWDAAIDIRGSPSRVEDDLWLDLVQASAELEGELESLFFRLTTQRRLTPNEKDRLGRFRMGFKRLRESLEDRSELQWRVQHRSDKQRIEGYVAFKALAADLIS
jgi:hypothetical protein